MAKQSMITIPASILKRAVSETDILKTPLENLPRELLLCISRYTDLFSLVNIARCSARLAERVYNGRLLDVDIFNLSAMEKEVLLDSVPLIYRPAEFKKCRLDGAPASKSFVLTRASGISCKLCEYTKCKDSSSTRSYEKAWFRHLRMEVESNKGRVPRRMVPLLYRALKLLETEYDRKLNNAGFLRLNVPGIQPAPNDNHTDQQSESDSSESEEEASESD